MKDSKNIIFNIPKNKFNEVLEDDFIKDINITLDEVKTVAESWELNEDFGEVISIILPDGTVYDLDSFDVHVYFANVFTQPEASIDDDKEDTTKDAYDVLDYLYYNLGIIGTNSGTSYYDDHCKVIICKKPTDIQYSKIREFLDASLDKRYVWIYCEEEYNKYDFEQVTVDEIINKIKRYFTFGRLEESYNNLDGTHKIWLKSRTIKKDDGSKKQIKGKFVDIPRNEIACKIHDNLIKLGFDVETENPSLYYYNSDEDIKESKGADIYIDPAKNNGTQFHIRIVDDGYLQFRELYLDENRQGHGIADKLIKATLEAINSSWQVEVHVNLNNRFWSHIANKYPNYRWTGVNILKEMMDFKKISPITYFIPTILKRIWGREFPNYHIEEVNIEDIVKTNHLLDNNSVLERRPDIWGSSYKNYHFKPDVAAYDVHYPIRLDQKHRILDGNHRFIALFNDGYKTAEVLVKNKDTVKEESLNESLKESINKYYRLEIEDSFGDREGLWTGAFNLIPTKETIENYPEDFEELTPDERRNYYQFDYLLNKLSKIKSPGVDTNFNGFRENDIFAFTSNKYAEIKDIINEMRQVLKELGFKLIVKELDVDDVEISYRDDDQIAFHKSELEKELDEKIVKKGNKWQVQSEKGRNMGTYDTKKEAQKRLGQVEYFKHMNESLDEINTGLQNLGFEHSTNGIEHLFKTDNDLSNFIRFDLDDKNKVLRIKGFGILEKGKGLGGKVINIILSNIPNEYTVELENNFNPDFWNHIKSKYPNLKFKDVKKVYEGLHVIKPEEEPKELENIVYYDDTGLNYITYKNNEVSVANRQENPIKVPHNIKEIKIDDIYTIQVTPESEFINKQHYANDSAPAIIVVENNGKYYLLEGNHRTWAREYAGKDTIKADVYKLADIVKQVHYFKHINEDLSTEFSYTLEDICKQYPDLISNSYKPCGNAFIMPDGKFILSGKKFDTHRDFAIQTIMDLENKTLDEIDDEWDTNYVLKSFTEYFNLIRVNDGSNEEMDDRAYFVILKNTITPAQHNSLLNYLDVVLKAHTARSVQAFVGYNQRHGYWKMSSTLSSDKILDDCKFAMTRGFFAESLNKSKGKDTFIFNGKKAWSGAVNTLDGTIEEIHSYKEAAEYGFHHSFYFSDNQLMKMEEGETCFFCVFPDHTIQINGMMRFNPEDVGIVLDEKFLENRIREQITFTD